MDILFEELKLAKTIFVYYNRKSDSIHCEWKVGTHPLQVLKSIITLEGRYTGLPSEVVAFLERKAIFCHYPYKKEEDD